MAGLIDDHIRLSLARRCRRHPVADKSVRTSMTEFASQANMDADQFMEPIGKAGVDAETFRDFVYSGMLWREVARAKLGPAIVISEADIDRALAGAAPPRPPFRCGWPRSCCRPPGRRAARRWRWRIIWNWNCAPAAILPHWPTPIPPAPRPAGAALRARLDAAVADEARCRRRRARAESRRIFRSGGAGQYGGDLHGMQEFKQDRLPPAGKKVVDYAEFLIPTRRAKSPSCATAPTIATIFTPWPRACLPGSFSGRRWRWRAAAPRWARRWCCSGPRRKLGGADARRLAGPPDALPPGASRKRRSRPATR